LGISDSSVIFGLFVLFILNVALFITSYYVLESGYKLKS